MPNDLLVSNGKKFMWDGVDYPSGEAASEKAQKYRDNGFEVEIDKGEGKVYLYTRRVVKEVVLADS